MPYKETKVEKLYYTIGEVAVMFNVNTSLIRFWEKEFDIIKPKKNKKGNRLFTKKDIDNFHIIFHLVKERGMTLKGAKKKMKENKEDTEHNFEIIKSLENIKELLIEVRETPLIMIKLKKITGALERLAPLSFQESYDNSGLQLGDPEMEVNGILITLDVTEEVVEEAVRLGFNLIISHHPVIFGGLKSITGRTAPKGSWPGASGRESPSTAHIPILIPFRKGSTKPWQPGWGSVKLKILEPRKGLLEKARGFRSHRSDLYR